MKISFVKIKPPNFKKSIYQNVEARGLYYECGQAHMKAHINVITFCVASIPTLRNK